MMKPRVLVLCTVRTGLDAVAELLRQGFEVDSIVGMHPDHADPIAISGYTDVAPFANRWGVRHVYVTSYGLTAGGDQTRITALSFDLIWVAGWQRLIPQWLIDLAPLGAIGVHGSPDGVLGGRGRSPQNWALMLGCESFELSLFRLTAGVDDGPLVATQRFTYLETDDISVSYKKAALCAGQMMGDLLRDVRALKHGRTQIPDGCYYPQRRPSDGYADWTLSVREVWAHCRALTHPYPGLRTKTLDDREYIIWRCQPFDDNATKPPGTVCARFEDGTLLVACRDGRLLVTEYESCSAPNAIASHTLLVSVPFSETMRLIRQRHEERYGANQPLAKRILLAGGS